MIKTTNTKITIPLIWDGDSAIDAEKSDMIKYARDPAEVSEHVKLKEYESATVWHCRPLDSQEYQRALQQSYVSLPPGADSVVKNAAQALCALPISLVRVENLYEAGDCIEGKALAKALRSVTWEVKRDIGSLVVKMSMGVRGAAPHNILAARWLDLSVAADVLLDEIDGADLAPAGDFALAIEKMREVLRPSAASVDPKNEGEGEDLGK